MQGPDVDPTSRAVQACRPFCGFSLGIKTVVVGIYSALGYLDHWGGTRRDPVIKQTPAACLISKLGVPRSPLVATYVFVKVGLQGMLTEVA